MQGPCQLLFQPILGAHLHVEGFPTPVYAPKSYHCIFQIGAPACQMHKFSAKINFNRKDGPLPVDLTVLASRTLHIITVKKESVSF